MSQSSQLENVVATWSRLQSALWESCLGPTQGGGSPSWQEMCARPLDIGEDAVHTALQTQSDCMRIALKGLRPGNGAPKLMSDWLDQVESTTNQCLEAQQNAWHSWFAALRQFDPAGSANVSSTASNVFDVWRQATEQTLKTQADWVSAMANSGAEAGAQMVDSMREGATLNGGNGAKTASQSDQAPKTGARKGGESKSASA